MTAVERFYINGLSQIDLSATIEVCPSDEGYWVRSEAHDAAIAALTAELQQSRDIREDMGLLLTMLSQRLCVLQEPHQTWNDRILEAASRLERCRQALVDVLDEARSCGDSTAGMNNGLDRIIDIAADALKEGA